MKYGSTSQKGYEQIVQEKKKGHYTRWEFCRPWNRFWKLKGKEITLTQSILCGHPSTNSTAEQGLTLVI